MDATCVVQNISNELPEDFSVDSKKEVQFPSVAESDGPESSSPSNHLRERRMQEPALERDPLRRIFVPNSLVAP